MKKWNKKSYEALIVAIGLVWLGVGCFLLFLYPNSLLGLVVLIGNGAYSLIVTFWPVISPALRKCWDAFQTGMENYHNDYGGRPKM
jgi:hypothetical protein